MSRDVWEVEIYPSKCALLAYRGLEETVHHQVKKDLEKLSSRGLEATEPLVGFFEGDIRYVRSKHEQVWIRSFFFRDGKRSFCVFYIYEKDSDRIPRRVKSAILAEHKRVKRAKDARQQE